MLARIYKPAKTAMQSGRAGAAHWVLEFETASPLRPNEFMGWSSSTDPNGQVRLFFDTREQAIEFARSRNIAHVVENAREPKRIVKSYADNFAFRRKEPWSH